MAHNRRFPSQTATLHHQLSDQHPPNTTTFNATTHFYPTLNPKAGAHISTIHPNKNHTIPAKQETKT